MTKYNEYRLHAERFDKFLSALSTHGAATIDLSINRRVRMVKSDAGIPQVWTETYKNGEGWKPEQEIDGGVR